VAGSALSEVIAIDGPSGSGKGAVGRLVARTLGWHLLDSGALYRLVGLAAQNRGIGLDNGAALATLAARLDADFDTETAGETRILLDGADVTDLIRSETAGEAASQVAVIPEVRTGLLARQRDFRRPPGLVADGRDMGSVVFPDARLKVFLTASPEARAIRRYKQLKEKGMDASLSNLSEDIAKRDARDATRSIAPLRPADGALILDSTDLNLEQVVETVLNAWRHHVRTPRN
jgi:cytidylate kinase